MKPFVEQAHTTQNNIIEHPFYQSPKEGDSWKFGQLNQNGQNILVELVNQYAIPKEISYLYLGLKNEKESFIYKKITYMNLETIKNQVKLYRLDNQKEFIDLAMTYGGMGYCWIIAWHTKEQKYFIRLDGGSNGYECQYNYNRYNKKNINWTKVKDIMMDWIELKNFIDKEYNGEEINQFSKYDIGRRI